MQKNSFTAVSLAGATTVLASSVFAQDMTGAYAGIAYESTNGGVDNWSELDLGATPGAGFFLGYNHDFGQFFIGGEVAVSQSEMSNSSEWFAVDNVIDLKLKAGTSFGDYAVYGIVSSSSASWSAYGEYSGNLAGTGFGVGVERQLSDRFSLGVEYLSRSMGDSDASYDNDDITTLALRGIISF